MGSLYPFLTNKQTDFEKNTSTEDGSLADETTNS